MLKISSWNVNGLRAILRKGALQDFLAKYSPDILCVQEIKSREDQIDFDFASLGYTCFWTPAERPGYSGTGILVKGSIIKKNEVTALEIPEVLSGATRRLRPSISCATPATAGGRDNGDRKELLEFRTDIALSEGRITTLDCGRFYLVCVYTPNSKDDLSRLSLREHDWDPAFLAYLKSLEATKPVITCGDFNAAHEEIDLARPDNNHHNAGFTDEERQGITNLLAANFIDTFRFLHPATRKYSWWSYRGRARENNVGWRIDYFFISGSLKDSLESAEIHDDITGSDHCPISITMNFEA